MNDKFTSTRCMHSLDHAHPERQRFLREQAEKVSRDAMIYGTGVMQHVPMEKFLKSEREATMPVRTFYGWLFMAFCGGFVVAVVLAGLIGRPI